MKNWLSYFKLWAQIVDHLDYVEFFRFWRQKYIILTTVHYMNVF